MLVIICSKAVEHIIFFDYGDEWGHSISVKKVIPIKKKDCKFKLLQIMGEIPEQYPDYDDDEEE